MFVFVKRVFLVFLGLVVSPLAFILTVQAQTTNLALNRPVVASSTESTTHSASNAVDGNMSTRWSSNFSDPQWIYVDLGSSRAISQVKLIWEAASGRNYVVEGSNVSDFSTKITLVTRTNMPDGARTDDFTGLSGSFRYIRMYGTVRTTQYGYSLFEFEVYGATTPAYTLSNSVSPANTGTIGLNPAGGRYSAGTVVTVTATPVVGYSFLNWSGSITSASSSITITMDANKTLVGNFTSALLPPNITITSDLGC